METMCVSVFFFGFFFSLLHTFVIVLTLVLIGLSLTYTKKTFFFLVTYFNVPPMTHTHRRFCSGSSSSQTEKYIPNESILSL